MPSKSLKPQELVETQLARVRGRLLKVSPVDEEKTARALEVMLTLAKTDLAKCDVKSVLLAALNVVKLGLSPDPQLGHVYVLPFGGKATLIVGYKGFIELARRSGMKSIRVNPVYANDEFEYSDGVPLVLKHKPWWVVDAAEPGAYRAAYVVAEINGGEQVAVYPVSELDKAKKHSASAKTGKGPWFDHPNEMRLKTAVRRASKLWSLSPELARAVELDERADEGTAQDLGDFTDAIDAEEVEAGTHSFKPLDMPERGEATDA
jgi:recombination protein RecT